MISENPNFSKLDRRYIFADVAERVAAEHAAHPERKILSLGIGDVTRPLSSPVSEAMAEAAREMGTPEGFRGYGDPCGSRALREAIVTFYRERRGILLSPDEIFVSDGAKRDLSDLSELFSKNNTVWMQNPGYPVYSEVTRLAGRRFVLGDATGANGFLPMPEENDRLDLIYLCSPNNPTGAAYPKKTLAAWVSYALENDAVILFDAAYAAFVRDPDVPRSIYEIPEAKRCAIEIASFSKFAGFTGVRCGFSVLPKALKVGGVSFSSLWKRRQEAKSNGISHITERGAIAALSGAALADEITGIDSYLAGARRLRTALSALGFSVVGGENAPYLWVACPERLSSFSFFSLLLTECSVVVTPGVGFGSAGEGYVRLSSFAPHADIEDAIARITARFG